MIILRNTCLSFGARRILDNVNFTFETGEVYVVQGASGTGKSTLLNIIADYLPLSSGRLECDGPVEYLLQDELLFSQLSVDENLRIRALTSLRSRSAESSSATAAALSRLGLSGRGASLVAQLSGGERRRVELAGMLLNSPSILLLDEPVGNLDPDHARDVYQAVWDIREGKTVLIVTHERDLSAMPDQVNRLTLADGKLLHA